MVVVHEDFQRRFLFLFGEDLDAASADDALVGHRAVAFVAEILQLVVAIHLEGDAAVLFHDGDLLAFQGAVEVEAKLARPPADAEVDGQDVGIAVFVVEGEAADVALLHDFEQLVFVGDLALFLSHDNSSPQGVFRA